jgi:glycosyltransferase involved in cell wall biosynthesis
VTDFRDPWTRGTTFQPPTPFHRRRHEQLEKKAYEKCDHFIANTPGFKAGEIERYPWLAAKTTVITNGFDAEEAASVGPFPFNGGGAWRLSYVGSWHRRFYTDHLFTALGAFTQKNPGVPVEAHYSGHHFEPFAAAAARAGLKMKLIDHGFLPHRAALSLMASSNLLLLTLPQDERAASWVPTKVYEYLSSGTPIFSVGPEGDSSGLVALQGANLPPAAPDFKIKAAAMLKNFHAAWRAGKPRPRPETLAPWHYSTLTKQLAAVFDKVSA